MVDDLDDRHRLFSNAGDAHAVTLVLRSLSVCDIVSSSICVGKPCTLLMLLHLMEMLVPLIRHKMLTFFL
jgi:hypothetical protein